MTHNEKRGNIWQEAQASLFAGSIYGATHTFTGHPLDTLKSKMQLQFQDQRHSTLRVAQMIYKQEGFIGFFRGCIPPLWGSMLYRGVMMSSYEWAYTYMELHFNDDAFVRYELGLTALRPMVPIASLFAAVMRGCIESPIEYAKVMGQINQRWKFRDLYRGFLYQVYRTAALITPIFCILDYFRRKTDVLNTLMGNFVVTAAASGGAYLLCWPLETLKNLSQAGVPHPRASLTQKIRFLGGPWGLFRGVTPGVTAGALRNGCGMVAMVYAQQWATYLGLRG